jgi:hypothetical protein
VKSKTQDGARAPSFHRSKVQRGEAATLRCGQTHNHSAFAQAGVTIATKFAHLHGECVLAMTTPDATFLEEVEDFLVSFDLPTFPTLQTLTDDHSGEPLLAEALSVPKQAVDDVRSRRTRKKAKAVVDAAAKYELAKAKDRKRRSDYRERRRVEKETLKQQVGELTAELGELQKSKAAERSLASSAWEMVAKRQLQARVKAEEKQHRIVRAVESRARMIEAFKGFVHDRVTDVDEAEPYQHKRIRLEPSDAELFKLYMKDLDATYAQTDEALRSYGLDATDASWDRPRRHWKEDGETGCYLYADKYAMPYNFEQICRHTWYVAQMPHRQEDRERFDVVDDPENTSAFKFRVTTCLHSGRKVSLLQRAVVRRYVQDNRSVIVWRSFTEGEGMFAGMHADESGWCVSIPLSNSPEPSTLLLTMMRHVPMYFSTKPLQAPDAKQFTGLVLDTGTEDATEISSRLEKLILQDE